MKCSKHPRYKGIRQPTTKLNCDCKQVYAEHNYLECGDCGKYKEDVQDTICPYAEEIANKTIAITVCKECYRERLYDI